jgi:phenylalanyl-tRNA synthetase beta chain
MKFSANWLRELVPGLAEDAAAIGRQITIKTAECEGVEPWGAHMSEVCAARVVSVEPMDGSHNRKAVVETGRYGRKTVVCGAPNCREGLLTAYVPAGIALAGREIRKAVIGGVESDGMLASAAELGINRDHEGVIELACEPGALIPGCVPDHVIEIDNKSITHRPDLWGHHGMAREVAAIFGLKAKDPVDLAVLPAAGGPLRVEIENRRLCPRYSALVFENVTIAPSPHWLQYRLEAIGLNPINNIVDVTNLVLAELGQPTHAFDADLLNGDTIFVRLARPGERVQALNGEDYSLDENALVIADAHGAEAIAGVIGGRPTGIHEGTRRVVLESANFQAASVRKTSSRLKVRTDASMRFEKAQDPRNTVRALARCRELFELVSPGIRLAGGLIDNCAPLVDPAEIHLDLNWVDRKIGRHVDPREVHSILTSLEFGIRDDGPHALAVRVPSWRATKDISIPADLVEEVGRMIGYDTIPPVAPLVPTVPPPDEPMREYMHSVRLRVAAQGFTEVYNYSFLSEERAREFGLDPGAHLVVTNPIASDQGLLRTTLIPGIARNIADNSRHLESFRLFEIGNEIHKRDGGLPDEVAHLAAAIYAREGDGAAGLYELKRLAACLLPGIEFVPAAALPYEHPARAFEARHEGTRIGRLLELHPSRCEGRGAVLDLDLRALEQLSRAPKRYSPLRKYPSSAFDLSILAGMREMVGDLQKLVAAQCGPELQSIEFVRQYAGAPLPEGRKSVSFRLTVGAGDRTLSADDIGEIRERVIEGLQRVGYELRL